LRTNMDGQDAQEDFENGGCPITPHQDQI